MYEIVKIIVIWIDTNETGRLILGDVHVQKSFPFVYIKYHIILDT
jgi:hypothetical protein